MNKIRTSEQVYQGLIQGKNKKQIARELNISRTTVHKYSQQPFFLRLTSQDEETLREVQTLLFNTLKDLFPKLKMKLREFEQVPHIYVKLLNTLINLTDKTHRTLDSYKPSKQVSIEQYQDRKLIEIEADI